MNGTFSKKYVVALAVLAASVLVLGSVFRPKRATPEPPSPSETASLQTRLRREQLSETAAYFAERAGILGEYVTYNREHGASAVAWEKTGQVITASTPESPAFDPPVLIAKTGTGSPPVQLLAEPHAGRWLLIVGRTADGQLLWNPVVYGGARQTTCAGKAFRELVVNARPNDALLGAGVFDLDGALVGVVANCSGSYHLISAASIPDLIRSFESDSRKTASAYGFEVEDLGDLSKRFFALPEGVFVTELLIGAAAAEAGLQAGDVITSSSGKPISTNRELWGVLASGDNQARNFEIRRNNRKLYIQMPDLIRARQIRAASESLGIHIVPVLKEQEPLQIFPGSPSYRAGLRTGDRLLRIGNKVSSRPGPEALTRAVSTMGDEPILLIWQHDLAQKAALVSK